MITTVLKERPDTEESYDKEEVDFGRVCCNPCRGLKTPSHDIIRRCECW